MSNREQVEAGNNMKILVTGANGFVGAKLIQSLSKENEVYCISRREDSGPSHPNIQWIQQDLSNKIDYSVLPERIDSIVHLAQSRHYREFPEKALDIFNVNDNSTLQLLDYGRKVGIQSFVFASTGGVYAATSGPMREDSLLNPQGFYPLSKYIAERLVQSYAPYFSTSILRLFFIYGEDQANMLIPNLIRSVKEGRSVTLNSETGIKITPTYVSDVVRAIGQAIKMEGHEIINVSGDEIISMVEIARTIGEILKIQPNYEYAPNPNTMDFVVDNRKMKDLLGIVPEVPFREGLERTIRSIV